MAQKDSALESRREYWDHIGNWDREARSVGASYRVLPDGDTEWYDDDGTPMPLAGWEQEILDRANVITHPSHYVSHPSGIEPIDITKYETFLRGNIIKYVMRAPYKHNELEDLKKARQYLDWEIDRIERERAA